MKKNPIEKNVKSEHVHQENIRAKSVAKYLRIAPRKVRPIINAVRYRPVFQAFGLLASLKNKAARMTEKVLKSAVANAKVLGLDEQRLIISEVRADGGPSFKRFMSRSMGRADRILKRTTHLTMFVSEGFKSWEKPLNQFETETEAEGKTKLKAKPKAKKASGKKKVGAGSAS